MYVWPARRKEHLLFRLENAILAPFRNVFKDVCALTKCEKNQNEDKKDGKQLIYRNSTHIFHKLVQKGLYKPFKLFKLQKKNYYLLVKKPNNCPNLLFRATPYCTYTTFHATSARLHSKHGNGNNKALFINLNPNFDQSITLNCNYPFFSRVYKFVWRRRAWPIKSTLANARARRIMIVVSGDVELNPGPKGKLTIGTYNVRG